MTFLILETAREDINQIHKYLETENPAVADAQVGMFLDPIERLGEFPLIGKVSSFDPKL